MLPVRHYVVLCRTIISKSLLETLPIPHPAVIPCYTEIHYEHFHTDADASCSLGSGSPPLLFFPLSPNLGPISPFDFAGCQPSGITAIATSALKYSVAAVFAHAKDEEIPKAPTLSTCRTLQIVQHRQSFTVLDHPHIGTRHYRAGSISFINPLFLMTDAEWAFTLSPRPHTMAGPSARPRPLGRIEISTSDPLNVGYLSMFSMNMATQLHRCESDNPSWKSLHKRTRWMQLRDGLNTNDRYKRELCGRDILSIRNKMSR